MAEYNAKSIQHLNFREGCRLRVGVYLGSADNDGVLNGLLEIVNNSTDEANAGFGNKIEINVKDKFARVRDYGRGIPRGKTDKAEEILITLLTENHSGAKFDKQAYSGFSRGLNGSGGGATCVSSDWMDVISSRDGGMWHMHFDNGIPSTPTATLIKSCQETGTIVEWAPSQEVFSTEEIHFDYNKICQIMEEYSYFNTNIEFIITNDDTGEFRKFISKNGLSDFADSRIIDSLHKTPLKYSVKQDGIEVEIIAKWTKGREKYFLFVNGAECPEGGTPITGAKTGITRTINNLCEKSFDGDLIRKGFVYVISIKHPTPIFANQIKSKISNAELRGICDKAFAIAITDFTKMNKTEFEKIFEILTKTEKAEAAADKARNAILNATKELADIRKKKVFASDKLKDAVKLGQESILILTEGNSAGGTMITARDPDKYGVLFLRGKIISALTNPFDKVLENEEVKLIISALGLSLKNYKAKDLRYGKVAIATDADADGAGITNLIVALFHVLFPEVLKEGRLYKFYSPLYKVEKGKEVFYYYSEEEMQKGIKGTKQARFKGLGSLNATDAKDIFFNPKNQRLEQLVWDESCIKIIEDLLGEDVEPRKKFVFSEINFEEYGQV